MQTFLPYPSFAESAAVLDRQRLGKQRVEAWQVLRACAGATAGWRTHPASLMWAAYPLALAAYGVAICDAWIARGYRDSLRPRFLAALRAGVSDHGGPAAAYEIARTFPRDAAEVSDQGAAAPVVDLSAVPFPFWLGDPAFHASHRANLLRKAPQWYSQFGWAESPDLPYVWPISL